MARKNFLKQAQHSIVDSQTLIAEEPIQEDHIVESKRGQYEGTTRLKGARKIPLNKIKPDPNQPRTTFDEESLSELANSIKQHGVLEPITVEYIQTEGYFKIISGERRYRASQLSELTQMPCIVRTTNDSERLAIQLIENIQREDLSPVDKARGLLELKEKLGKKTQWKEIEEITGISERRRQQFLALLNLPKQIQSDIVALKSKSSKNLITEGHARALLKLKDEAKQFKLFRQIKESKNPISSQEAMQIAHKMSNGGISSRQKKFVINYMTDDELLSKLKKKIKELEKSLK